MRQNARVTAFKNDPYRITKIKPFMNKYNWEGINYPSELIGNNLKKIM